MIRTKIEQYANDPITQTSNVKQLMGEPTVYRLRVGDWRVLFTNDGEIIAIVRVAPRGGAYD